MLANLDDFDHPQVDRILTFAVTEKDNIETKTITDKNNNVWRVEGGIPANVQGLHFRWGSLVGIYGTAPNSFNSTNIRFVPQGFTPPTNWIWSESATNTVPYINSSEFEFESIGQDTFIDEYPGLGYSVSDAKGDVCRYISDMGWVEGNWRLPTALEWKMLGDETLRAPNGKNFNIIPESSNPVTLNQETYGEDKRSTGTGYLHGVSELPQSRLLGVGVTTSDVPGVSGTNPPGHRESPGKDRILLPTGGHRNNGNGNLSYVGQYAYYASSTPSTTSGQIFYAYHSASTVTMMRSSGSSYGMSVRCIQNYNNK
jgi:hypothetical protein